MTPSALAVPEMNEKGLAAIERAKAFFIASDDDYRAVDQFCVALKGLEKEVDAAYDEHISTAFQAHRSLVAKKKKFAEPIAEARTIAKRKLDEWDEKKRAEAEAEAARLRAEALKRAEDEALAKAQRAAEFGDDKAADAIISAPVVVEPVKAVVETPKRQSAPTQTRWGATITAPTFVRDSIKAAAEIVKGLPASQGRDSALALLREAYTSAGYMVFDQVKLNQQATATKDALEVGGVKFAARKV